MKFLTPFIICYFCKHVYCDPGSGTGDSSENQPKSQDDGKGAPSGSTPPKGGLDKLIKSGCNFSDKTDMGVSPFGSIKKADDEVCIVETREDSNYFLYSCDGVSDPPTCPEVVKIEDSDVNIQTLYTQATVTNKTADHGGVSTFHVITGKTQREFKAKCICTKKDGKTETMSLTSSFDKVGILAVFGTFLLVALNYF